MGPPWLHGNRVNAATFRRDGRVALTGSYDRTARLWEVPSPVGGDAGRVVRWTQVRTGMRIDPDGVVRALDAPAWEQLRQELGETPDEEEYRRRFPQYADRLKRHIDSYRARLSARAGAGKGLPPRPPEDAFDKGRDLCPASGAGSKLGRGAGPNGSRSSVLGAMGSTSATSGAACASGGWTGVFRAE